MERLFLGNFGDEVAKNGRRESYKKPSRVYCATNTDVFLLNI